MKKVSPLDRLLLVGVAAFALIFLFAASARSEDHMPSVGDFAPVNFNARSPMLFAQFAEVQGLMSDHPTLTIVVLFMIGLVVMRFGPNLKAAWNALKAGDVATAAKDVQSIGASLLSTVTGNTAGQVFDEAAGATQTLLQVAVRSGNPELLAAITAIVPEIQKLKKGIAVLLLVGCSAMVGCGSSKPPEGHYFGYAPTPEDKAIMDGAPIECLSQAAPELVEPQKP